MVGLCGPHSSALYNGTVAYLLSLADGLLGESEKNPLYSRRVWEPKKLQEVISIDVSNPSFSGSLRSKNVPFAR